MCAETNFKDIWNRQQPVSRPAAKEITAQATHVKRRVRNTTLLAILLLTATIVFILLLMYYAKPRMLTTAIGTALFCTGILMYILVAGSQLRFLFTSHDENQTVKQQLEQLLVLRTKQAFLQKKILTLYFIFLAAGILLYMIEYTLKMSTAGKALVYGLTMLWFAFSWFYIRPRTVRKQQLRINEVIARLEQVSQQLEGE